MKVRVILRFWLLCSLAALQGAPSLRGAEPLCRIAAVSNVYLTDLPPDQLGERSWLAAAAPAGLERTIAVANAVRPDAMVVLGSLTWTGSESELALVRERLAGIEAPLYVVPGPRDLADGKDERFRRYFADEDVSNRAVQVRGVHLQFASLGDTSGEAQLKAVARMRTGLSTSAGAKAVLLFSALDPPALDDPARATPVQREYWDLIHRHHVAARMSGSHSHWVGYTDRLPYWSIPSSGWSYSPKWALALISVYEKHLELDLIQDDFQPVQRLVIPNPVAAPRMVAAADDPYGVPTYTEDLERRPELTFAQLSDSQFDDGTVPRYAARFRYDEPMNELAVAQVNRLKPALAFMTGDLTNKNTPAEWQTFQRIYSRLEVPFYPVPGNHDLLYDRRKLDRKTLGDLLESGVRNWEVADKLAGGRADDPAMLFRHFMQREPYYAVEKNGCVFLCLNTGVASVDDAQVEWLRGELERTRDARHVFVLGHYPLLNEFGGNVQGPQAQEILALLRRYKVAAYLSGHRHRYGYRMHDGTAHVLCDCLCWGEYRSYQVYHVFDDRIVACWKPIFRADGNRPLYERVVFPEPRFHGRPR